jgi:phosphoenolpyruvate carboxylase
VLDEHALTTSWVLDVLGHERLLQDRPVLGQAVSLRNPYVDALSLVQVRALAALRRGDARAGGEEERLHRLLLLSAGGVAAGLQNTG